MTLSNERLIARAAKNVATAQELIDAGFCTKAAQSRALGELNRAYENCRQAVRDLVIDYARERVPAWNLGTDYADAGWQEYNQILDAYEIPFDLHQVRPVHVERAAIHSAELASAIEAQVALRTVAKATPVVPQPKDETVQRIAAVRASIIEELAKRRAQYVDALDMARAFNGLPVSVNAHYVRHEQGTVFLRHYFYLAGRLTPLQIILAAADTYAREKEAAA